jgi:four helix bundle protein
MDQNTPGKGGGKRLRVLDSASGLGKLVLEACSQNLLRSHKSLAEQMRRSSLSISSNIAEGLGRGTNRDCLNFLFIAKGSLQELEVQVDIAIDGRLIAESTRVEIRSLLKMTARDLGGLIYVRCKRLEADGTKPPRLRRRK